MQQVLPMLSARFCIYFLMKRQQHRVAFVLDLLNNTKTMGAYEIRPEKFIDFIDMKTQRRRPTRESK